MSNGFINYTGKDIIIGHAFYYSFQEGLAPFFNSHSILSFINKSGKVVLTPKYKDYILGNEYEVTQFSEGLLPCLIRKDINGDWHNYIYINKKGELAIKQQFLFADNFSENLGFIILLNGETGYIDKKGILQIHLNKGERGFPFSEGFAVILDSTGNSYFIDKRGFILGNKTYKKADSFSDGMARVEVNEKLGFINTKGELVIKPIYNYASTYDFSEGIASVSMDDPEKPGSYKHVTFLIDKSGNKVSKDFRDNCHIHKFQGKLAFGTQSTSNFDCNVYFYINRLGKIVWKDTIWNSQF